MSPMSPMASHSFRPTRFRPIGNTFLKSSRDNTEHTRSLTKAHSLPEFIPYHYGGEPVKEPVDTRIHVAAEGLQGNLQRCPLSDERAKHTRALRGGKHVCDMSDMDCSNSTVTNMSEPDASTCELRNDTSAPTAVGSNLGSNVGSCYRSYADSNLSWGSTSMELPSGPPVANDRNSWDQTAWGSISSLPSMSMPLASPPPASPMPTSPMQSSPSPSDWSAPEPARKPGRRHQYDGPTTTLIIRNIQQEMTHAVLVQKLDQAGFKGSYDFVYVPVEFASEHGKGYAFVNLVSADEALRLTAAWDRKRPFGMPPQGPALHLEPASLQGLAANMARWGSSKRQRIRNPKHRPLVILPGGGANLTSSMLPLTQGPKPTRELRQPTRPPPQQVQARSPPQRALPSRQQEAASFFAPGQRCRIGNLTRNTEANGRCGYVECWEPNSERYVVKSVSSSGDSSVYRLRAENLYADAGWTA
mmetsp:Transcript_49539/g.146357  ORF Transcript_49539/g.146357 Transcript_49539/m.146357 type:complete len:472 (+) Transcript_49539:64-1479(+)